MGAFIIIVIVIVIIIWANSGNKSSSSNSNRTNSTTTYKPPTTDSRETEYERILREQRQRQKQEEDKLKALKLQQEQEAKRREEIARINEAQRKKEIFRQQRCKSDWQQYQNGEGANHTKKRLPVKLVYYEEFQRIDEAFYREKQVQRWVRKKKEALINGNYEKLHGFAECNNDTHFKNFKNGE